MKKLFFIAAIMCALFAKANAQSESTKYFYMGYLYTSAENDQHEFYPYLTVLLSKEAEPDKVIAATMSDPRGEFSFRGVPIDCEQTYLFAVLMPNGTKRVFRCKGGKVSWPSGNLSTNICLDGGYIPSNYYTNSLSVKDFDGVKKRNFVGHVLQQCNVEAEDGSYYRKSDDATMMLFVERTLPADMSKKILGLLDSELVTSVNLIELSQPNDYFGGALNFNVVQDLHKSLSLQRAYVGSPLPEVK